MKRIQCIIFLIIFCLLLSSCGQIQDLETQNQEGKLHIVTTIFPYYDFVRAIGSDMVEVQLLLKPGTESHSYEPSPQDIIAIENCDLFVYNGGESDAWVEQILSTSSKGEGQIFKGMENTETALFEEEEGDGMQERILNRHEHEHGEEHEVEYDEHIWTSPVIAKELVSSLVRVLSVLDVDKAPQFSENADRYIAELDKLDQEFREVAAQGKRKNVVFGDRFPFLYFIKTYGLAYSAAFPGCSSESEPSAKTVAYLLDKVKKERIPAIFYIEFSNQKIADTICAETGAEKLLFHSCHNVTPEEMQAGITYLDLMQNNVGNLRKALNT